MVSSSIRTKSAALRKACSMTNPCELRFVLNLFYVLHELHKTN